MRTPFPLAFLPGLRGGACPAGEKLADALSSLLLASVARFGVTALISQRRRMVSGNTDTRRRIL